jgi:hypothetical protein
MLCIEDLVPDDHLLRDMDRAIDFGFIYELVRDMYCAGNGRPPSVRSRYSKSR